MPGDNDRIIKVVKAVGELEENIGMSVCSGMFERSKLTIRKARDELLDAEDDWLVEMLGVVKKLLVENENLRKRVCCSLVSLSQVGRDPDLNIPTIPLSNPCR